MALRIETPEGEEALLEFVAFADRVHASRAAYWPTFVGLDLPLLMGESAFAEGRSLRAFAARDGAEIVARVVAVADGRYQRHWGERLGHVVMFEALPDTGAAVRLLMDAACAWLAERGAEAVRAGFGVLEMPFVVDAYTPLPPAILRHNPPWYHALLKDAGFETEMGFVDYKIRVTPELEARWASALAAVQRAGIAIVPLRAVSERERPVLFARLFNETFAAHWGYTPTTPAEQETIFALFEGTGFLDTSVVAYRGDEPVGMLSVAPETTALAVVAPGHALADDEKLNFLGIGVRDVARGQGVNLAMAGHAFIALARAGARWVSYTLVLDHNWRSRRTAEKLGGAVCANYLAYRRELHRR